MSFLIGIMYKKVRLETDVMGKSDRAEWGHARYQTVFRPDQAYELIAEWLTSSGSIIGELVRYIIHIQHISSIKGFISAP